MHLLIQYLCFLLVFLSTGVRRNTTEKGLSGKVSTEATSLCTTVETEGQRIRACEVQTRRNTEVRNQDSKEANQENTSLSECTSATKTQALASSQAEATSHTPTAVQLLQPNELPMCTAVQSQASVSTSLSNSTQSKGLTQGSQVRIQSAAQPVSKSHTLPSPRSLKLAPSPQAPLLPAQSLGFPPGLLSKQIPSIAEPSVSLPQFHLSLVSHSVSQGQIQCKTTQAPVPQQQAPPFQFLPQITRLPNSQPNNVVSSGQVLLPAGMSPFQSVSSSPQACRMPDSSELSRNPSLPTAFGAVAPPSHVVLRPVPPTPSQAHPYQLQSLQVSGAPQMPNQTQVLPRETQIPVSVNPQGQQNTAKNAESPLPFTHVSARSITPRAAFCSVTTPKPYSPISPSLIRASFPPVQNLSPLAPPVQIPLQSTMLSSPSMQSSSLGPVPSRGSLTQTSSPAHRPSACFPSALHVQSNTPPAILQQNHSVLSIMHLGTPTISSAPCPVPSNMSSLPLEHNSSVCQMGSNMPLVGLLQNSAPAPIPSVRSSDPDLQHQLPPGHSFQSTHETSQVPLTYPLESLYASLDPMHDLEEPTLTTLHPPSMFDQTNMLTENLSSAVSSQQCVPLAQPGVSLQTPCIASDQFSSNHSESLTFPGPPNSTLANVDLNRQFRNPPTCSGLPGVSAQQSDGSSTNKSEVSQEGQGHSNSNLLKLRSHIRTPPESSRTCTRQSEPEGNSLDDSEESKLKSSQHQLSSARSTNQTEGDTSTLYGIASEKSDLSEDGKEVGQKRSAKSGKTQAPKNQCEVCGRVLSNASALENHSRLHTGERPFSCDKCGKAFPSVRGLNRHVQIHAEEKQHQCPECGKSFVYHFTLTKHQLIHTGEKPFPCKVCGKRFLAKADRATHMRMHTGEKPYSCTLCGKRFKHRMALNMHMQGHRGEKRYSCPTCDKGFVDLGNFKRHKRIHTGEKPYECKVCGKRFTQSAHLKKHVNTQHITDQ